MKHKNFILKRMMGLTAEVPHTYYEMPSRYRESFYLANASFFDSVNWFLHKAYETVFPELVLELKRISGLDEKRASERVQSLIGILDQCNNVMDLRFPVKRKRGNFELIRSFKAKHGSYIGFPSNVMGLRIIPDLKKDDLKGLGVLSTHRLSMMGLKNVGSFGGIKIDPSEYEMEELRDIITQYASRCLREENTKNLFIDCDINCDHIATGWINREIGAHQCDEVSASQGAFFGIHFFLNNDLITSKLECPKGLLGKTFIVQGFGKMGSNLALYLQSAGAKCVGVKEHNCYIYNKNGLEVNDLISFKKERGDLTGYEMAKPEDNFEIYKEECDILVLAAKQRSILCHFAKSIKAKLIVEAAYHPITPTAYMILKGHSKVVLPDLLICGGPAVAACAQHLEENIKEKSADGKSALVVRQQMIPQNLVEAIEDSGTKVLPSTYTIANLVYNKSQELMNTCEKYNLGYDFKTAAFVVSIRNIFGEIFSSRLF